MSNAAPTTCSTVLQPCKPMAEGTGMGDGRGVQLAVATSVPWTVPSMPHLCRFTWHHGTEHLWQSSSYWAGPLRMQILQFRRQQQHCVPRAPCCKSCSR
jgi:hypothetical protein